MGNHKNLVYVTLSKRESGLVARFVAEGSSVIGALNFSIQLSREKGVYDTDFRVLRNSRREALKGLVASGDFQNFAVNYDASGTDEPKARQFLLPGIHNKNSVSYNHRGRVITRYNGRRAYIRDSD